MRSTKKKKKSLIFIFINTSSGTMAEKPITIKYLNNIAWLFFYSI